MKFAQMLQDYYAERLGRMYILKANWLYKTMYAIIKPFLSRKTKDKVFLIFNKFCSLLY